MEQNNKQTMPCFELGYLYVFKEEDEDGELTIIGKLIGKNESEDTLTFGNQYEIENEKFVTDQAFDLRISVHEELREATEDEAILFQNAFTLWKKSKNQPSFRTFDKVLVRNSDEHKWRSPIPRGKPIHPRQNLCRPRNRRIFRPTACYSSLCHRSTAQKG